MADTERRHEARDVTVAVFGAEIDDAIVVQVDTGARTGHLRVNVNDGPVFDANPEEGEATSTVLLHRIEALEASAMQLALDLGALRQSITSTTPQERGEQ